MKKKIEEFFDRLWPLNRSLTGDANRESLKILSEIIPLKIAEVKSGTTCFDWTVPPEWNVKEAWVKNEKGETIIDFAQNNLHLLGYSIPFDGILSFDELEPHLYSLEEQPDLIPYLTSYYQRRWGFCLSHNQLKQLDKNQKYQVRIDSNLNEQGSMTVSDCVLKGKSHEEVLLSTYICHPSMASNELSGPLVTAFVYDRLKEMDLHYTYRFVFVPETIGSIYYLSEHGDDLRNNLVAGFIVTTVGDDGHFTFKKSRRANSLVDRAVALVLEQSETNYSIEEFSPIGSDERQYCSPGFNLPVGSLMRTKYGTYDEYHTSGDNKSFVSFEAMEETVEKYVDVIDLIENNRYYRNKFPNCEPQLGKRGLYPTLSEKKKAIEIEAMMWVLNYADGEHDLIDICRKSNIHFKTIIRVAKNLYENNVLTY